MKSATTLRWAAIAVLLVATMVLVGANWGAEEGVGLVPASAGIPSATATVELRLALERRVGHYLDLRLADRWPALYELTDPVQRRSVDLVRFLDAYGHGVLRVEDISARSLRLDPDRGLAIVDLHTEARLVPERLPPEFRRGLDVSDPEALRKSTDHAQHWVLRDGEWYYRLEDEIASGFDSEGQELRSVGAGPG
jgi:hypothetical protein